ncbi:hypothetical protein T12_5099 [Trichinella patagoniensis]|uniref:Uncharacterized protein n=1 Tax=Trichinella patagoniensis TaxID=990121 RepID=A0A0V0YPQ7_9BILA|nr:hypothetical protein T12_5099 [Trichinella patagoniensis]
MCFDVPKEFGVPDEIGDMTRSLEMVETVTGIRRGVYGPYWAIRE